MMNENEIGSLILDIATDIHRNLGPGLLERVYESILEKKITEAGLSVRRQVPVSIFYEGHQYDEGFVADLIVADKVLLELKSIEYINKAHKKQLLTYLKLTNIKLGYILNFSAELMKHGIHRCINGDISPS